MTPAKSEREKAHIEELLNAGAAELAERMKSTGSPPMIPAEAAFAKLIVAAINVLRDHVERYGMLPELPCKKRALIHNGRKPR